MVVIRHSRPKCFALCSDERNRFGLFVTWLSVEGIHRTDLEIEQRYDNQNRQSARDPNVTRVSEYLGQKLQLRKEKSKCGSNLKACIQ